MNKYMISVAIFLFSFPAFAEFFGYQGSVRWRQLPENVQQYSEIGGRSLAECQQSLNQYISILINEFHDIQEIRNCTPIPVFTGTFPIPEPMWQVEPCFVCYWNIPEYDWSGIFGTFTPDALSLIQQYKIESYQAELEQLQKTYQIQDFLGKMYDLEQSVPQQ